MTKHLALLDRVRAMGLKAPAGMNLIAFSGGVDSSVVAAAVYKAFPQNTICVLGRSSSLSKAQLTLARDVANFIGAPLREVHTDEGSHSKYVENKGQSCYVCKTQLYSSLQAVHEEVRRQLSYDTSLGVKLFNGTNKDDLGDDTRVGLVAAREFEVLSPLSTYSKAEVREIATEFGLPNHSHAASPCLRSRLAYGIQATSNNLERIESAEEVVKGVISLQVHNNMRVRHMANNIARVELDEELLSVHESKLHELGEQLVSLGFAGVEFKQFRSGSVAHRLTRQ